jgi:hypothetical protein
LVCSDGDPELNVQDFNLLVSELQALSVEAKRRHTDVKDVRPTV